MSSTTTLNSTDSHHNKRRKINDATTSTSSTPTAHQIRWRTSTEHHSYTCKLIHALRHVHNNNTARPTSTTRVVREAADKALAISAKGRTRWSRAILFNRVKLQRLKNRHKKAKAIHSLSISISPKSNSNANALPPIEKRVKVLSRLVPGCNKLSFPKVLEEATDYIAALQMQVRTMAALAELLSGSSTSAGLMAVDSSSSTSNNINNVENDNPVQLGI